MQKDVLLDLPLSDYRQTPRRNGLPQSLSRKFHGHEEVESWHQDGPAHNKPTPFIFPYIYHPRAATLGGLKPFSFALTLSEVCYSFAKMPCQSKSNTLSYSALRFPHAVCAAGINELFASLCESAFCLPNLQSSSQRTSRGREQDFLSHGPYTLFQELGQLNSALDPRPQRLTHQYRWCI